MSSDGFLLFDARSPPFPSSFWCPEDCCSSDIVRFSSQYMSNPGAASSHDDGLNAVLVARSQMFFRKSAYYITFVIFVCACDGKGSAGVCVCARARARVC